MRAVVEVDMPKIPTMDPKKITWTKVRLSEQFDLMKPHLKFRSPKSFLVSLTHAHCTALDAVEKKTGHVFSRDQNEKITDKARETFEKATGKHVPEKFSN